MCSSCIVGVMSVMSASCSMMMISFFSDRSVVGKATPTVLVATSLAYHRSQHVPQRRPWGKSLTAHMITSAFLLDRGLAPRAHFGLRLEVSCSGQFLLFLGSFVLLSSLVARDAGMHFNIASDTCLLMAFLTVHDGVLGKTLLTGLASWCAAALEAAASLCCLEGKVKVSNQSPYKLGYYQFDRHSLLTLQISEALRIAGYHYIQETLHKPRRGS